MAAAYPAAPAGPEWLGAEAMLIKQIVVLNGEMMLDDGMGGAGSRFPVTIKSGSSRPKQLAELHGVVVARIVAPPEPVLTVTDVFGKGKDQVCRTEGLTCQVTALEKNALRPSPIQSTVRLGDQDIPTVRLGSNEVPSKPSEYATFTIRLVSTGDAANEILNLPVQIKGRLQPFLRINRRSGMAQPNLPEFQVLDADGKPLRILTTRPMESNFDGTTMSQAVQLVIDKPGKGLDGISFTILARRPVVVEMPFVLKDVPLP